MWVLVVMLLELQLRLLVVFMWPRKLSGVRVKIGVGGRGRIIGGISLTRGQLGARVDDDDMALLKVFHQGMEILEVETAASVVAALGNDDRLLSNERETKEWGKVRDSRARLRVPWQRARP